MRTVLDCAPSPEAGCPREETIVFRVGVDIGGTFTDIVFLDEGGRLHTKKVSSSVDDYARAIVDGLGEIFRDAGIAGATSPRCSTAPLLPQTPCSSRRARARGSSRPAGFRDVLEIRRLRMPRSMTSPGRSRRRSSSATCARRSPSASTRTAPSRRRSPWPRSRRPSSGSAARASRRSPSASSTPTPTRRTRSRSRRWSAGARRAWWPATASRCCRRSGSTSARRPR